MDHSWQNWIQEALNKGCDRNELRQILRNNHFTEAQIVEHLDGREPDPLAVHNAANYRALTTIRITRGAARRIETELLQLYVLEDFMTAEECDTLVSLSEQDLYPSTVDTGYIDAGHRTSRSFDLYPNRHPLIGTIDARMSETIGIHAAYADITQIQHYSVGQEFKPHHDYFHAGTAAYEKYARVYGNRTWTFMVYLTDTPKGGGTKFTEIDQTFYPKRGRAVIWNNLDAEGKPNPHTMHWGQPVEEGKKVIITKWYRERCTAPMILG